MKGRPPSRWSRARPVKAPNTTRKITGRPRAESARRRLRQKVSWWQRSWWMSSLRSLAIALGQASLLTGQQQIGLLQRRSCHREVAQLYTPLKRPAGEQVERGHRLPRLQLDAIAGKAHRRPRGDRRRPSRGAAPRRGRQAARPPPGGGL